MSERYSRLYALPENLYAVGSPVVIAAGTLLKDNQTGKVVAQLKLRSISNRIIKAVKVRLDLFDTAGNPIGEPVVYDYLDLSASRDVAFGQKVPIHVSEIKARSYAVAVQEVVFADKTTWSASDTSWESLPRQKTLDAVFGDSELVKQYKIAVGTNCSYYPLEKKDIWFCVCGALNHADESCNACHRTLFELQTIDPDQLTKEKDARVAQEKAAAEEKAAAQKAAAEATKKKTAKILKIVIPAVCVVIAFVILLNSVIIPNGKYNEAVALMEAGQYEDAIAAFDSMDGYKDSATKIKACETAILDSKYADAVVLMEAGQYKDAIAVFEALNKYKDASEKVAECAMLAEKPAYDAAVALEESGEIARAAIAFAKLTAYPDTKKHSLALWDKVAVRNAISDSWRFILGLKEDGKAIVTRNSVINDRFGFDELESWTGITSVAAGNCHYVVLFKDGTVKTGGVVSDEADGSRHLYLGDNWSDIVAISAKENISMGLKYDGTVVVGVSDRKVDVSDWTDIIAISAGDHHIVGLKSDRTVVAKYVGKNSEKYKNCCDVSTWRDVVAISACNNFTLGLKADGTVLFAGTADYGIDKCQEWTDIISISAGNSHAVGLRSDGTVVAIGYNGSGQCDVDDWTNIVAISADWHTVGLRADGTVVAIGNNEAAYYKKYYGVCNTGSWKNIKVPN